MICAITFSQPIRDAKKTLRGGLKGVGLCGSLYIQVLSIDPALRGQNLGTELLQKAEAYAKSKDYSLLYLDTFSFQNPLSRNIIST